MANISIRHARPVPADDLLRRIARGDPIERMQRRLVAAPTVLADHIAHGSLAEPGIVIRVRGEVGEEGPGLVVVPGVDGPVDDDLEGIADDLLQVDLGGGGGLAVRGPRARAERRRLVGVGDPVRRGLPPGARAALVHPVALRVGDAVAPFVHHDARLGDVVLLDLEPGEAARGVAVHDARGAREARDGVDVDLVERAVVGGGVVGQPRRAPADGVHEAVVGALEHGQRVARLCPRRAVHAEVRRVCVRAPAGPDVRVRREGRGGRGRCEGGRGGLVQGYCGAVGHMEKEDGHGRWDRLGGHCCSRVLMMDNAWTWSFTLVSADHIMSSDGTIPTEGIFYYIKKAPGYVLSLPFAMVCFGVTVANVPPITRWTKHKKSQSFILLRPSRSSGQSLGSYVSSRL